MIMAAWKLGPALAAGNSGGAQAQREEPAHRDALAELAIRPACRRVYSTSCPATATRPAKRWRCTWTSTPSASPAATRVGRKMLEYAAGRSNLKRVYNTNWAASRPSWCSTDFAHIERAAKTVAGSMFFNQGEQLQCAARASCTKVADRFLEVDRRRSAKVRAGRSALRPRRDGRWSTNADEDRARLHRRRQQRRRRSWSPAASARRAETGSFVEPTVFERVRNDDENRPRGDLRPGDGVIRFAGRSRAITRWPTTQLRPAGQRVERQRQRARTAWHALRLRHRASTSTTKTTSPCLRRLQAERQRPRQEPARLRQVPELKTTWLRIDAA